VNEIYIRRKRKLILKTEAESGQIPLSHVATFQKNVESLGFAFSKEALDAMSSMSDDRFARFCKTTTKQLQRIVGAHRPYRPMYPNFPAQVMAASSAELYINAIVHYMTLATPEFVKETRPRLIENPELRLVEPGTKEDFEEIFTSLAASRSSLSDEDKTDLGWFIDQYRDQIKRLLPDEVPFKENLAVIASRLIRNTTFGREWTANRTKVATDVLRIAVAMSDGDVSLAEPTKFGKFTRSERKFLLRLIESTGTRVEDMHRWKERWKRLGERLHPTEYAERFPMSAKAFQILRNDEGFKSFHRSLERSLASGRIEKATNMLADRPGDFARRLDHLLRLASDQGKVIDSFSKVSYSVSSPVLLQVLTHFENRSDLKPVRTFFPKGSVAKLYARTNTLPEMDRRVCKAVVEQCRIALISQFASRKPLGKCYVDPKLENYFAPFSQRSAAKALRTIVRGSRLPMPEETTDAETLRFFLWWKNGRSRTDLDLSGALFDSDYRFVDAISYHNLKNFGGHHSGDITDAPHGASEFIDLSLKKCRRHKVRYIVPTIHSFTNQPYCDLPECFMGWMMRKRPNAGEIYEPKTVRDKVDIASNTRVCVPMIFDIEAKQAIWTDVGLTGDPILNNVNTTLCGLSLITRSMDTLVKTNLRTLFELHAAARGELVPTKSEADQVFAVDDGITPFDLDEIAADFI